ncbi:MAG: hypothetical protein NW205_00680 [Hyphomicrobiaceae bacterium]|nr:hypothetical protein [Hyphomicrobiaceae bacterium]
MAELDEHRVADAIREALRREFSKLQINEVYVAIDRDRDGEDILRVNVVYEGRFEPTDGERLASAVRKLRPVLNGINIALFPLLTFVSKQEYRNTTVEAR